MYVGIGREKDRRNLSISKPFSYSPALYWNWLPVKRMALRYGGQTLTEYEAVSEMLVESAHDRIYPFTIPYKGGAVTRNQLFNCHTSESIHSKSMFSDSPIYPGVWHTSHVYEVCLVEQLPFINEAFMQQTPAFRGEQLTLEFVIEPSMIPYNPNDLDFSYDYSLTASRQATAQVINGANCYKLNSDDPIWRYIAKDLPDIGQDQFEGLIPPTTDDWNMNNDNLMVHVVFAQNALWQLNPLFAKVVFERFG
jgi:hypothetical protein